MRTIALVLAFLLIPGLAWAKSPRLEVFEDGEAIKVQPGAAYLIVRTIAEADFPVDFVFVKLLTADELRAATAKWQEDHDFGRMENVVILHGRDSYARAGELKTFVLAVEPGTYLFAEQSGGINGTCVCMGSVKFEAKAGAVTDLGTILAARDHLPTSIPELTNVVRQKRILEDHWWFLMAIRPATAVADVPESLRALPAEVADYRAVNKFPNYFGTLADRLQPIAGVLGYDDEGNVLDLKSGGPAAAVAPK
jgi:hypothetical protein